MSRIRSMFDAKTIAFGGVATGKMKANDAETVTGSMRTRGFWFIFTAREARKGRRMDTLAVLDINSVMIDTAKQRAAMR